MRRIYLYFLLFFLLLVAIGVWFYKSRSWSSASQNVTLLPPRTELTGITLIQGNDTLCFERAQERWYEMQTQRLATENSIQTLLDYFQRIEVRFPIHGGLPEDEIRHLQDSGLFVALRTAKVLQSFTLGNSTSGDLILFYNEEYFLVRTVGFSRSTIQELTLKPEAWTERSLAIRRPSDLEAIVLRWPAEEKSSFSIQIHDSLHVALWGVTKQEEYTYDTIRMSAFLYALTTLELDQRNDSIAPLTRTRLRNAVPMLTLQLLRRGEYDTTTYQLFRGQTLYPGAALRGLGYLLVNDTGIRTTPLVSWDAVLTTLDEIKR